MSHDLHPTVPAAELLEPGEQPAAELLVEEVKSAAEAGAVFQAPPAEDRVLAVEWDHLREGNYLPAVASARSQEGNKPVEDYRAGNLALLSDKPGWE